MRKIFITTILFMTTMLSAITMDEWMNRGGPSRDPYNSKCMTYCNTYYADCRNNISRTATGNSWVNANKYCSDKYNRCVDRCRKTK